MSKYRLLCGVPTGKALPVDVFIYTGHLSVVVAVCFMLVVAHQDQFVNVCVGAGSGIYYCNTPSWHCIVF